MTCTPARAPATDGFDRHGYGHQMRKTDTSSTDGAVGDPAVSWAPRRRPTIGEVAAAANVSPSTVSRVMNGAATVAADLADRVRHAAHALGYEPNAIAQSLVRGRTGLAGIVVPDLANPLFQSILRGLSGEAGLSDYRILIADSHEVREEEPILMSEMRRRCDALVLCAPRMGDDQLRELVSSPHPVVLINRRLDGLDVPTVSVDYGAGTRAVARHLVDLGHRRIAFLGGPPTSASNAERLSVLGEMARGGLDLVEVPAGAMFADGFAAADQALAHDVTAIVGYNDLVAYGALARLHERGVAVPGEVSVTGFDDIPFARYASPPLTTVAVPQEQLGVEAWRRLRAVLTEEQVPDDARFVPELVVRASTGTARSDA